MSIGSLSNCRGFTLVEIMVAVAIFAVVSATLLRNSTQSVSLSRSIQDRSLAQWIAENELQQLRLQPRDDEHYPPTGVDRSTLSMANREWQVMVDISATENELVRRLDISVFDELDLDSPLAELTGFIGQH